MSITNYQFEVTRIESGQRKKYGGSFGKYIIKNNCEIDYAESVVQSFCMGFVDPAITKNERDRRLAKGDHDAGWLNMCTGFKKIGDREYEYTTEQRSTH